MAEITPKTTDKRKRGITRATGKLSTRVDLTPMVDLGFLLITFFIFTTTMSNPTAMGLVLPDERPDPGREMHQYESGALTIIPTANNRFFYYEGILEPAGRNFVSTDLKGIRNAIIRKKSVADPSKLLVIIKPDESTNYGSMVKVLDEMTINMIKKYVLISSLNADESRLIATDNNNIVNH